MPSVCVCDCGLAVADGLLCVDWATVGMHRQCSTADPYSNPLAGLSSSEEWFQLRDVHVDWTNTTCRTHRVVLRVQVPFMLIKLGEGNRWEARVMLDGAIDSFTLPYDTARTPEMVWSSVWSNGMPLGTDQEQQTPGDAKREFLVPPGSRLFAGARVEARVPAYVARPQNRLEFGSTRLTLSAWPAKVDSGSGRTC